MEDSDISSEATPSRVHVSFGGLLLRVTAGRDRTKGLTMDRKVYLLINKM